MPPSELTLQIEKPAAGGRMIARHDGQIVLVSGAIPGERVRAAIEQIRGGVIYARATAVDEPSPDRRPAFCDPACGGTVYAHVAYARQCALKSAIVTDAFARIAHVALDHEVPVRASPERGYRMRARLHVRGPRVGFFREGTHDLCDAAPTGQLLPATIEIVTEAGRRLRRMRPVVRELELSENIDATNRAIAVEVDPVATMGEATSVLEAFDLPGITGTIVGTPGRRAAAARGTPYVVDRLDVVADGDPAQVTLRRHAAAFFQGNRFLLQPLAETVVAHVPPGTLIDLYAGAGLFGLAWAALGRGRVIAVEGDRQSGADLVANAGPLGDTVQPITAPVERYLAGPFQPGDATVLVDPPRTGMSRDATAAIATAGAPRLVYVSCDVATLARDVRRFVDAGYQLTHIEAFDLFPNTAHVETLVVLERSRPTHS